MTATGNTALISKPAQSEVKADALYELFSGWSDPQIYAAVNAALAGRRTARARRRARELAKAPDRF